MQTRSICALLKAILALLVLALCAVSFGSAVSVALGYEHAENIAEQSEKQVLRFVHPRGLSCLDNLFLKLHPDVSFEYLDWDPSEPSLYTPDSNPVVEFYCEDPAVPPIDIYVLSAVEGLPRLIQEGYVLDLSSSESISAAHATYFPQAQAALSSDGKPMAVPIYFSLAGWDYNKKAWDAFEMPNVPKTADEIIRLIGRWNQDILLPPEIALYGTGGFYPRKIQLLMDVINMYVIQYASSDAALNFDTPEFRDMINRIVNLPELPCTISISPPLLRCESNTYPRTFSLLGLDKGSNPDQEIAYILPMSFSTSKPAKVGAEIEVICIARNTLNRELALEYVEFVLKHQADRQEDLQAMLTLDAREMDILGISNETQALYHDIMPGITFDIGALGGFWPTEYQGEYFWIVFLNAYSLDDEEYGQTFWDTLISLMREDLNPLIAELNEEAQRFFADRY